MYRFLGNNIEAEDEKEIFEIASKIELDDAFLKLPTVTFENKKKIADLLALTLKIFEIEENIETFATRMIPEHRKIMQESQNPTEHIEQLETLNERLEAQKLALQENLENLNNTMGDLIERMAKAGLDFYGAALDPNLVKKSPIVFHAVLQPFTAESEDLFSGPLGNIKIQDDQFKLIQTKGTTYTRAVRGAVVENELSNDDLKPIVETMKNEVQKRITSGMIRKLRTALVEIKKSDLNPTEKAVNVLVACQYSKNVIQMGRAKLSEDEQKRFDVEFAGEIHNAGAELKRTVDLLEKNLIELTENSLDRDQLTGTESYILTRIIPSLMMIQRSGFVDPAPAALASIHALKSINSAIASALTLIAQNPNDANLIKYHDSLYEFRIKMMENSDLRPEQMTDIHFDLLSKTHEPSKSVRAVLTAPPMTASISFRMNLQLATIGNQPSSIGSMNEKYAQEDRAEFIKPYLKAIKTLATDACKTQQIHIFDIIQISAQASKDTRAIKFFADEILEEIKKIISSLDLTNPTLENTIANIKAYIFFQEEVAKSNILTAASPIARTDFEALLQKTGDGITRLIEKFENTILSHMVSEFAAKTSYLVMGDAIILSNNFKKDFSILEKLNKEKSIGTEPSSIKDQLIEKIKKHFDSILKSTKISYDQIKDLLEALDRLKSSHILAITELSDITNHIQEVTFRSPANRLTIIEYLDRYKEENNASTLKFERLDTYRSAAFGERLDINISSLDILGNSAADLNTKLKNNELKVVNNLFKRGLNSVHIVIDSKNSTEAQINLLKALITTAFNNNPLLTVSVSYFSVEHAIHQAKESLSELLKIRNMKGQKLALDIDQKFESAESMDKFVRQCDDTGLAPEEIKKLYIAQLLAKDPNITAENLVKKLGGEDQSIFENLAFLSRNTGHSRIFLMMAKHYQESNPDRSIKYLESISDKSELYHEALLEIVKNGSTSKAMAAATQLLAYDANIKSEDSFPRAQVVIVKLLGSASRPSDPDTFKILKILINYLDRRGTEIFGAHNIDSLKSVLSAKNHMPLSEEQVELIKIILSLENIERPYDLLPENVRSAYADSIAKTESIISEFGPELLTNQIELLLNYKKSKESIKVRLEALINLKSDPSKIITLMMDRIISDQGPLSKEQIDTALFLLEKYSSKLMLNPERFIKDMASLADKLMNEKNPEAALRVIELAVQALPPEMRERSLSNNYYLMIKPLRDLLKPFELAGKNRTKENLQLFLKSLVTDEEGMEKQALYQGRAAIIIDSNVNNLSSRITNLKANASNMQSQTGAAKVSTVASVFTSVASALGRSTSPSNPSRSNTPPLSSEIPDDYEIIDAEAGNSSIQNQDSAPSHETQLFIKLFGIAAAGNVNRAVSNPDPQRPNNRDYSYAMTELAKLEAALQQLDSMITDKPNQGIFDKLKLTFNLGFQAPSSRSGDKNENLLGTNCKLPEQLYPEDKAAIKSMIKELRACIAQKRITLKSEAANSGISDLLHYFDKKAAAAYSDYRAANAPASQQETAKNNLYKTQTKAINMIRLLKLVLELRKSIKTPGVNREEAINIYKNAFNEWRRSDLDVAPFRAHSEASSLGKAFKHATSFITGKEVECKVLQEAIDVDSLIALAESDQNLDAPIAKLEIFNKKEITNMDLVENLKKSFDDTMNDISAAGSKAMKYMSQLASDTLATATGEKTLAEKVSDVKERHRPTHHDNK